MIRGRSRSKDKYKSSGKAACIYLLGMFAVAGEVCICLSEEDAIRGAYPKYENEWKVIARPDGRLTNLTDGQEYSCLYREILLEKEEERPESLRYSCVIRGEETSAFLQEIFIKMGLIPSEYNELIISWIPELEEHPWNRITIQADVDDALENVQILPKPDRAIRVTAVFEGMDSAEETEIPKIEELPFIRQGFTVVEVCGAETGEEAEAKSKEKAEPKSSRLKKYAEIFPCAY